MSIPGFEEESAEDKEFWENPTGPPPAPAGVDPDAYQAAVQASVTEDAPEDAPAPDEGEPQVQETVEEGPEDDQADAPGEEVGEPDPAPANPEMEALAARVAAYEKRLADKDEFINRQANELGDLRNRTSQIEQQANLSGWDEILYENPARAAELALNAGDQRRYMQAREAWEEVAPGAARNYEQNITLQRELEQLKAQLYQSTEPLHARAELEQVATAYSQVKEKYPDYDDFEDAMGEVLNTRPLMKESLQSVLRNGDLQQQAAALEDLYLLTAGRKRDTLNEAANEAKATLDATAKAQRTAANVVTGGASPETVGQSIADKIGNEWDELAAPYEDGWQV